MKKQDLIGAMDTITLDEKTEREMLNKLLNFAHEKEKIKMSKKKKTIIIMAAAALALGAVVYASSGLIASWSGSSSSDPEYTRYPTEEQITKDIGYVPEMVETFQNGYTFDNASVVENSLEDENGSSVEEFKSILAEYKKDGDVLIFSADKFESEMELSGTLSTSINDVELYYDSYTTKAVPVDYEMTDEDKKAEESGELIFTSGSNEVTIQKVQGLTWTQDGVLYSFTQIDGALSQDELIKMAEEIIDK